MAFSPITHLRHFDIAVPDYRKAGRVLQEPLGPHRMENDGGVTYFAAEGSPEQYVDPRARGRGQAPRHGRVRRGGPRPRWTQLASDLAAQGREARLASPIDLQTLGGGYGFRFFDLEGRTIEVSSDVEVRKHRKIEETRGDPGAALPRGAQLPGTGEDAGLVRAAPGLPALRHPEPPARRRPLLLHALQCAAPLHGDRPRPACLAAARVLRAARHRRVHARQRPAACAPGSRRSGARAATGPATTPSPTSRSQRQHHGVHHRARTVDEDTWHPSIFDMREPETSDQWGTGGDMDEFIAQRNVQRPRQGPVRGPPGIAAADND